MLFSCALLAAASGFLAAGCGDVAPKPAEIVGVWTSADGAKFEFGDDARFSATAIEKAMLFIDAPPGTANGAGRWKIAEANDRPTVELSFDDLPDCPGGFRAPLYIEGRGDSMLLYWDIDDEGFSRCEFHRR